MADSKYIKNVAIIGAAGQIGSQIVKSLLASKSPKIHITAITRADSSSSSGLPTSSQITVAKGSYEDVSFLTQALQGQDAFVFALGVTAPHELIPLFLKAAADAKVPYVLPTEFGSDTSRKELVQAIPLIQPKVAWRAEIERLGVSSWIGIVTNPWFDYSTKLGSFGIDVKAKKAVLFDDGNIKANTTMQATAGLAAAKVLMLPISAPSGSPSLESYKNKLVYVRSFNVTQNEMLEAIQRVTGKSGWQVSSRSLDGFIQEGKDKIAAGDFMGNINLVYGYTFKPGIGADYSGPLANEALELPEEDFDEAVRGIVAEIEQQQ